MSAVQIHNGSPREEKFISGGNGPWQDLGGGGLSDKHSWVTTRQVLETPENTK